MITIFQIPAAAVATIATEPTICPHQVHRSHRNSTMSPTIPFYMVLTQMIWSQVNLAIRVANHWRPFSWIIDAQKITAIPISSTIFCVKQAVVIKCEIFLSISIHFIKLQLIEKKNAHQQQQHLQWLIELHAIERVQSQCKICCCSYIQISLIKVASHWKAHILSNVLAFNDCFYFMFSSFFSSSVCPPNLD